MVLPGKNPARRAAPGSGGNMQRHGEIRHQRTQGQPGIIRRQPAHHVPQIGAGNIDRGIAAGALQRVQQDTNLAQRPGAEFHDLGISADQGGNLTGMAAQQRHFGAGLVIFRQGADGIEQRRAFRVIKIFAGDFLGGAAQAIADAAGEAVVEAGRARDCVNTARVHHASSASRMPLNCQRARAGKSCDRRSRA